MVFRASGPISRSFAAPLASITVPEGVERTAIILVGRALAASGFDDSRLYAADYDRRYRPLGDDPRFPEPT